MVKVKTHCCHSFIDLSQYIYTVQYLQHMEFFFFFYQFLINKNSKGNSCRPGEIVQTQPPAFSQHSNPKHILDKTYIYISL